MTRETKFRIWDKQNKRMINPNHLDYQKFLVDSCGNLCGLDLTTFTWQGILSKTLYEIQWYTGMKDKDGVEIYEGDIVELTTGLFTRIKCKVIFDCYGFMFEEINGYMIDFIGSCDTDEMDVIVIGNIYENPEFLEG